MTGDSKSEGWVPADDAGPWNRVYVPEGVPDYQCGLCFEYPENQLSPESYTCERESWADHQRCLWHANVEGKPPDELVDARGAGSERLDGAVLRDVELGDRVSFEGCRLTGADFTDGNLQGAYLFNANLQGADLQDANFSKALLQNAELADANLAETDLSEAQLGDADLTGAFLPEADLSKTFLFSTRLADATLWGVTLNNTIFTSADLTNVDFRNSYVADNGSINFLGATAIGVGIKYKLFDNLKIDERTTFGGRSRYEAEADNSAIDKIPFSVKPSFLRCLVRPFSKPSGLEQAELQYRATQRILRENALGEEPKLDVREKHARRKRMLAEWGSTDFRKHPRRWLSYPRRWFTLAIARWTTLYGESPWRVVYTSAALILGFGIVYPFVGGMQTTSAGTHTFEFDLLPTVTPSVPYWLEVLLANLYFSAVTFTTLGYGDIQPASPFGQLLASIESFAGAALMALLVAVVARRITR